MGIWMYWKLKIKNRIIYFGKIDKELARVDVNFTIALFQRSTTKKTETFSRSIFSPFYRGPAVQTINHCKRKEKKVSQRGGWAKRIDIKSFFTNSVRVHSFKLRNQEFNKGCKSIFHYYSSIFPANGNHCSPTIHLRIILHKRVCFKFNACALCVSNTRTARQSTWKIDVHRFSQILFF